MQQLNMRYSDKKELVNRVFHFLETQELLFEDKPKHFCLVGGYKIRKIVVEMIKEVFYEYKIVSTKKTLFYNASNFHDEDSMTTTVANVVKAIEEAKGGMLVIDDAEEICSNSIQLIIGTLLEAINKRSSCVIILACNTKEDINQLLSQNNTLAIQFCRLFETTETVTSPTTSTTPSSSSSNLNFPLPKDPTKTYYLKRYEHMSKIGSGGQGGVYKCKDIETGETVAVKEYIDDASREAKHLQSVRKLFINGSIRNDHLAPYLDIGTENDKSYVVMPLYERDLMQELERRREKEPKEYMTEGEIVKAFIQIVYGVDFLHKNGLIHRDLKLKNVMIAKDGSIKIVDYNSMRQADNTQTVIYSYLYAAPEVFKDIMNEKSDIYAIGVMLFEMIALVSATVISSGPQTHFALEKPKEELNIHSQMNYKMNQNPYFTSSNLLKRIVLSIVQHDIGWGGFQNNNEVVEGTLSAVNCFTSKFIEY